MHADGGYTYSLGRSRVPWDNSNTQYAMLGAWAAAEAGMEVPALFWQASDAHWRTTKAPSVCWAYVQPAQGPTGNADDTPTPALTAAGVASLFVALDHRRTGSVGEDPSLARGLASVTADFRTSLPSLGDDLYYTFALQRVGVAAG